MDYSIQEFPTLSRNLDQTIYYTPYESDWQMSVTDYDMGISYGSQDTEENVFGAFSRTLFGNSTGDQAQSAWSNDALYRETLHSMYSGERGRATSFVEIHSQVSDNLFYGETEETTYPSMRKVRPTDPAVGELVPVGDGVIPMLVCAMVCIMVIFRKKREKQQ